MSGQIAELVILTGRKRNIACLDDETNAGRFTKTPSITSTSNDSDISKAIESHDKIKPTKLDHQIKLSPTAKGTDVRGGWLGKGHQRDGNPLRQPRRRTARQPKSSPVPCSKSEKRPVDSKTMATQRSATAKSLPDIVKRQQKCVASQKRSLYIAITDKIPGPDAVALPIEFQSLHQSAELPRHLRVQSNWPLCTLCLSSRERGFHVCLPSRLIGMDTGSRSFSYKKLDVRRRKTVRKLMVRRKKPRLIEGSLQGISSFGKVTHCKLRDEERVKSHFSVWRRDGPPDGSML